MIKWDIYTFKEGFCCRIARIGCIEIANIWTPLKGKRDYYQVRLLFNQDSGNIDFTKDKQFSTLEQCKAYIHKEFKKMVKLLNRYYVLNKNKPPIKTIVIPKSNTNAVEFLNESSRRKEETRKKIGKRLTEKFQPENKNQLK